MYWRCLGFLMIVLLAGNNLQAQSVSHFSGWGAWFSSTRINQQFSLHFDGQVRSNHNWKEVQTILLRPGINYHISKKKTATLGYAFIDHHRRINGIDGWGAEHRIWEQFIFNQSFAISRHFTTLQHRVRLEQRFVGKSETDGDRLKTAEYQFAQRLRYFARSIFPLQRSEAFKKGAFISLQDEIMVNVGKSPANNGKFFDQNRLYGSFGYRFSPKADLELGYMYQYVEGRGTVRTNNNILQVAVYTRL